jgi:hypothetical protein
VLTEAMELLRTGKVAFNSSTDRRLYWLRREFRNRFERDHPPDDGEQGTGRPDAGQPTDEKTSRYDLLEDWKGTVVQIDHSPFVIPQALRGNRSEAVRRRARHARRVLGRIGEDWPERKHQNAKVPAWPHKMTQESALALMYHGYVSAWANLYTLWAEGDDSPKLDYTEFEKRFGCPRQ